MRTDGNDANSGLANSSGGAFATLQRAADVIFGTLDLGGYDVTVQVADGTYTAGVLVEGAKVGAGKITFLGNAATPANVILTVTGASCFFAAEGASFAVGGFEVRAAGSAAFGLRAERGGEIEYSNMRFGACAIAHVRAGDHGRLRTAAGSYTIAGNAPVHFENVSGHLRAESLTITLSGTPSFSTAFARARLAGVSLLSANTFSGSATGMRYDVQSASIVYVNGAGASYFPGDASGTTATGGQYV